MTNNEKIERLKRLDHKFELLYRLKEFAIMAYNDDFTKEDVINYCSYLLDTDCDAVLTTSKDNYNIYNGGHNESN